MRMQAVAGALALVSLSAATRDLGAQASALPAVARVGIPAINTGLLRTGTEQFAVYMVDGSRRDLLARVTDEVTFAEFAPGDTALRRVYTWATGEDTWSHVDTIFVDRHDLTLRTYSSRTASSASRVEWENGRLHGELRIDGKATPIDAWLNAPVYIADVLDLVARASHLSSSYSTKLSTFSPESGTIANAALSVTGLDSIGIPQWRVQSEVRGMMTTFWVDTRSHRIIRQARYMGNGFRVEVVPVSPLTATTR